MRLSFEYKPEEHERTYIHDILKKLPQNQEATLKFSIPENSYNEENLNFSIPENSYNEASELLRHEMNIVEPN